MSQNPHVLEEYQKELEGLGKQDKERSKTAKRETSELEEMTKRCIEYLRGLIPDELAHKVKVTPSFYVDQLEIVVDGTTVMDGYISATANIKILREYMTTKFALISWKTESSYKCEFFEMGKGWMRISQKELDYRDDKLAIQINLHHCIGFGAGYGFYAQHASHLMLPTKVEEAGKGDGDTLTSP